MNGDTELSPSQILERVKPDRVTVTKPEEDRRRRTIIVEKKNATYGFTLQSYGIHYKKEQEIEMITYVDHVDYDGPAFRAGMREGDVILSINGRDMEKVDHKSLVNFIKSCDSRMRMVVLFEDCVRKVELHMRYIKLQNALKCKTLELEKLCVKEKELLSGKWKTHSLPARKKNPSAKNNNYDAKVSTDTEEDNLRRTTFSTEDVGQVQNYHRTQHHHFLIAYPRHPPYYIDAHGRAYYLHPSGVATPSSSKEYLVSTRSHKDGQRRRSSHSCDEAKYVVANGAKENSSGYQNGVANKNRNNSRNAQGHSELKKDAHKITRSKSYHQHICGGCLRGEKNTPESQENGSLEAYDLAGSSCCAAECVPTRRRRSHSHHAQKLKPSSSKTSLYSTNTTSKEYSESHSNRSTQVNIPTSFHNGTSSGGGGGGSGSGTSGVGFFRKHAKFEGVRKLDPSYRNLVSQNSLYSCTSTELPISHTQEQTVASYTTSLSTDTLYWDQPSSLQSTRKHSTKSTSSSTRHQYTQDHVKPVKSWDNLAAKSHNNYSCDYLDNSGKSYSTKNVSQINSTNRDRYFNQTQSSESLFYSQNLSEGSFSCEYLSSDNPTFISNEEGRFVPVMPSDLTNQRDKASQTDSSKRLVDVPQTPEITRL